MLDDDNDPVDAGGGDDAPLEGDDGAVEETESLEEVSEEQPSEAAEEGEALGVVRQQSSASQRIKQEVTRRKQLEAQLEESRRHIQEIQRREAVSKPVTEDPEEERRRLEFMDETQRVQYLVNKGIQSYQTDVRRLELQMNVSADKIGFGSYIAANPQFKKYADDVEVGFDKALRSGHPESRADILTKLIGAEVIKKGSVAIAKARQTGSDNIRRQQTKPGQVRSGVAGSTRRVETAEETLKRRLAAGEYT